MRVRSIIAITAVAGVCIPVALAWAGRPALPAPKPATAAGPPPAWAETTARSAWIAYSGYCWKTTCADYLPPASRPDVPTIRLARGASIRVHFGFRPTKLSITLLGAKTTTTAVAPAQVITWRPSEPGVATFSLKGSSGSASYAVKIRIR